MGMQLVKQPGRTAHKPLAKAAKPGSAHKPAVPASAIPDKLYFKIGEVAKLCGVETYVLRFWESEFPQLRPTKGGTGQRLYRKRDVETALTIRRLLYDEGFTIPGARQTFQQEARQGPGSCARSREKQTELPLALKPSTPLQVKKLKTELRAILGMLSTPVRTSRMESREKPEAGPSLFHP